MKIPCQSSLFSTAGILLVGAISCLNCSLGTFFFPYSSSSSFYFPLLFLSDLCFFIVLFDLSLLNHFWKSKTSCLRAVLGFDSWNQSSPGSKVLFLFLFQSISKCKRRTILKLIKGKQVLCFLKDYFNSFFCQKFLIQLLLVHFICDLKLCICYLICRSHLSCIIIFLNILF